MKRARQRKIKPRNPVAALPVLRKGGAHKRRDKHATRARLKALAREEQS